MMPKYTYLYGFTSNEVQVLETLPYKQALQYKIRAAKHLANTLQEVHYATRDIHRVNDIVKAIKFNNDLLEELK